MKPYSVDLRERLLWALDAGLSFPLSFYEARFNSTSIENN